MEITVDIKTATANNLILHSTFSNRSGVVNNDTRHLKKVCARLIKVPTPSNLTSHNKSCSNSHPERETNSAVFT